MCEQTDGPRESSFTLALRSIESDALNKVNKSLNLNENGNNLDGMGMTQYTVAKAS